MSITLYAQPYDVSAARFSFENAEDFNAKSAALRNDHGETVEEFEIQFIDGEAVDAALAEAVGLYQSNVGAFFDAVEDWNTDEKLSVIIAVGECGYSFDLSKDSPEDFDLDIYEMDSLRELAEHFVDEGLFGDIPERLQFYIDYDAIARDLGMDYAETTIAGQSLVYRCMCAVRLSKLPVAFPSSGRRANRTDPPLRPEVFDLSPCSP